MDVPRFHSRVPNSFSLRWLLVYTEMISSSLPVVISNILSCTGSAQAGEQPLPGWRVGYKAFRSSISVEASRLVSPFTFLPHLFLTHALTPLLS